MTVTVPILRLPHGQDLPLPEHATAHAAGLDLVAAVEVEQVIAPGAWAAVPTGIAIALPAGFEGQIRPRSGLALKMGLTLLNSPGTVDADYRGEIKVLLINHGHAPAVIQRGMRIAQLVVARHATVVWDEASGTLEPTARGEGGFGSTGVQVDTSAGKD